MVLLKSNEWTDYAKDQWNQNAQNWHARSKNMWEKGSRKEILPFLQSALPIGKKICDLGCGDGYAALKLAEAGYLVTGIDLSEQMISIAKSYQHPNVRFLVGDLSNVPIPDHSQDGVLAINSIEWTESPLDVIREIGRILIPKGIACIGILGPTAGPRENAYPRLLGEKVMMNTMMPWEFSKLASEHGFITLKELHVPKRETDRTILSTLPDPLKQAISFMTVFLLQKVN
ncbi:class I SAM-dependent methyltransferase [Bacillus smithii]|uniref:class I SAM-dependent methyltransferase n=1 Tax=Bacillus smithii TaxID=1479 RepID=UPI0030C9F4FA